MTVNHPHEGPKPKAKPALPMEQKITLDFPIDIDGVKTDTLTVRRPTVQNRLDAEALTGSELSIEMIMIANLCDIPPGAVNNMMWSDYRRLQNAVNELSGFQPR